MLIYYVLLIRESVLREFAHQGIGYPMPVILRWIHIVSFGNIIGFRNKQRDIDSTVIYLKIARHKTDGKMIYTHKPKLTPFVYLYKLTV